ncbi:hypothetical protein [Nannocystis pusilla]|uniref:hypothetical protein n=1 Tax=Nannocystis pusilla TaxID=889268 RepID=UPI003B7A54B8
MAVDVERLQRLWEDGEVALSRGVRRGDGAAVLVAFGPVARLEHEHALRQAIEPSWGAQPLGLARDGGGSRWSCATRAASCWSASSAARGT